MVKFPWQIDSYFDRPVDVDRLGEEIAFPQVWGQRRVIGEAIASGLTPMGLAAVLHQATLGQHRHYLTLAEEMEERYLHYASQLQTRRLAIEGVPVSIEHDGVPSKIVDAVTELVESSAYDEMVGALPDGIAKGYSAVEMMWEYERQVLRPVKYVWRDPRFFQFDEATLRELRLVDQADLRNGVELPAAKFIVHRPRSKMGLTVRAGMARPAAWAFLIQSFSLKDWASFAEIYGVPLRIGKYHSAATPADQRTLLHAVRSIGNDGAAVVPAGMEIEFQKVEGQHGASVFGGLIDYVDKQVSKLVLGQTMTSDDGGSLAQAKVHNEVRLDILQGDTKQLAQTINRDLIMPFVLMNFGPQDAYPRVAYPVPQPEDIKELTEAVARMVPLGLRVSQREMRERLGISEPQDDEELLGPPAAPATPEPAAKVPAEEKLPAALAAHHGGCRCTSCSAAALAASATGGPTSGTEEVEALAADALDGWEDVTDPLLSPIRRIMTQARSLDEALAMLDADGPDATRLAEALAVKTAIARGIGDVRD